MNNGQVLLCVLGASLFGGVVGGGTTWKREGQREVAATLFDERLGESVEEGENMDGEEETWSSPIRLEEERAAPAPVPVPIHPEDPIVGPSAATLTVVELVNLGTADGLRVARALDQALLQYGGKVRLVSKPWAPEADKRSNLVLESAMEAHAQGRYWEFRTRLIAEKPAPKRRALDRLAKAMGLDTERLGSALHQGRHVSQLTRNRTEAQAAGAQAAPTVIVNGRRLVSPQGPDEILPLLIDMDQQGP